MVRILSGGGKNSSGRPTTVTIGRPGFGSVARGFRQSVRRLAKRDPANGILNTPMSDVALYSLGVQATYTTALAGNDNDLKFTAIQPGTEGNSIRVRYVDPAAATQSLAVSVSGNDITVSLATDGSSVITSTATLVKNAINAHAGASALISAALASGNSGAGVVTAMAFQTLANGAEGEMREALPPGLGARPSTPRISGTEEQTITKPDIALTAPVRRRAGTGTNRRLRKR